MNQPDESQRSGGWRSEAAAVSQPAHLFGETLEPAVRETCDGRLSAVQWFRTDWQRGGALTGYATFDDDAGRAQRVVVKLPVPPRERQWLVALQETETADSHPRSGLGGGGGALSRPPSGAGIPAASPSLSGGVGVLSEGLPGPGEVPGGGWGRGGVVPRVYAHGETLNGYDLSWVVMQRLPHGPLSGAWGGREFDLIVDAAGRFYEAAHGAGIPLYAPVNGIRDWPGLLERARQRVQTRSIPASQRWKAALKRASRKLDGWTSIWHARPHEHWCHGDLHLGNAMSHLPPHAPESATGQTPRPDAACLIDLAEVHPGHWVEDAVYLEHLHWGDRHRLAGRKLVSLIAQQRKARGLDVGDDWPRLAEVLRHLLAMSVPALLHRVGPTHAEAALAILERGVG